MDQQEDSSEAALMDAQAPHDRTDLVRRGIVSIMVWGVVLAGFVIAIAMFTTHVMGWGG